MNLLKQLIEIKFEPLSHPFDKRMALELQSYFIEDGWDTEFETEEWLTDPESFQLDGTHPDLSSYLVHPYTLVMKKDQYELRAYFIRETNRHNADDTARIRICKKNRRGKDGKGGYRDAKIIAGSSAEDVWRRFNIAFKQKTIQA